MATGAVNDWTRVPLLVVPFLLEYTMLCCCSCSRFCCQVPFTRENGCSSLTWLVDHSDAVEPASGCRLGVARQLVAGCLGAVLKGCLLW